LNSDNKPDGEIHSNDDAENNIHVEIIII
jgi:hypothetical protein